MAREKRQHTAKIARLKTDWEAKRAACLAAHRRGNDLRLEAQALQREQRRGAATARRAHEIERRLAEIAGEVAALRREKARVCALANQAEIDYTTAKARLERAQANLRALTSPPPWGLGDYTSHELAYGRQQAEATIRELT